MASLCVSCQPEGPDTISASVKLFEAVRQGHAQCVKLLLETSGSDINECGRNGSALCEAIYKEHTGIIDLLILSGADVNKASRDGKTPLMVAAQKGNENIVKTMIRAGADVNLFRSE